MHFCLSEPCTPLCGTQFEKRQLSNLNIKILNTVEILKELLFDVSYNYVLEETLYYFEAQHTIIILHTYLT